MTARLAGSVGQGGQFDIDHQRRTPDQLSRDPRPHRAGGGGFQGVRPQWRHARRHDAAQRFCVLRSLGRGGGAGQPGGADQLASEGRGSRLHPGRQRRENPGLPRRPAAADQGRPARRCAAAGGDDAAGNRRGVQCRACADASPRRHDRLGPLARHACGIAGRRRSAARRCSIRRAPPACPRACAASR